MKLRVFLWNDDYDTMKHWQSALTKANFDVTASHEQNAAKVADAYRASGCDFVLLDVLHNTTDNPIGLMVAKEIRRFDLLVPMIAVTTKPEHIYSQGDSLSDLDFIGIFEDTIMLRHESLRELAVRQPLNLWHEVLPDFALVRGVLRGLDSLGLDGATPASLRTLIGRLPVSGGHDIWHGELCEGLAVILKETGTPDVADRFRRIVGQFRKADGFYMAAGWSRKHLSHNVQVFLLGLYFLLGLEKLRSAAAQGMKDLGAGSDDEAIVQAMLAWACVATTHDTAYLAQDSTKVQREFAAVANSLRAHIDPKLPVLEVTPWPTLHHGVIGARLWTDGIEQGKGPANAEERFRWLVAQGIARHDTKALPDLAKVPHLGVVTSAPVPLTPGTWIQFLAVMADELQDWQRNRPEELARFRSFVLDAVQIQPNSVALRFVTRDHSSVVRIEQGMDPAGKVESHLRGLLDRLAGYLSAGGAIKVELSVAFSSRGPLVRAVDQAL